MDQWYLIRYHSESNRQQTAASKFLQWTESLRKNSFDLHKNGKLFSLRNIGLAAMCCLALSGCGSYFVQNSLTGALVTSPATVSFGSVMVGRAVSTTVNVLNKGVTPIQLSQLTVNGKAFSASGNSNLPVTLAVGETYKLNVNFNPASAGAAAGQLIITSNSSTSPKAAVTLIGTGVPNDATIVPALTAVSCSNVTMTGSATQACSVQLSAAATAPFLVSLSSNNSAVAVPASVTVSQGASSAGFNATSSSVQSTQAVKLTATAGGVSETFAMQVAAAGQTPPALTAVSCSNATMTGSATQACSVQLSAAATAPFLVSLSSNNSAVAVPASVTVSQGASSAGFNATSSSVQSTQPVKLTATAGGVSEIFAMQVAAAAPPSSGQPGLTISSTNLSFGQVVLNNTATQTVTLTSSGSAPVSISAAKLTGSGFKMSGGSFPATLNPGQTVNLNLEFDPAVTGSETGQLVITSNSATNPGATVKLSGIGVPSSHEVKLSWDAPNSSPEPVTGYRVYRSSGNSGSYQLLNSSAVSATTYADTTVQGGQNYEYVVKSVDAAGAESPASDTTDVSIP